MIWSSSYSQCDPTDRSMKTHCCSSHNSWEPLIGDVVTLTSSLMYCQHNFSFNSVCLQSWFNILTHRLHYIWPSVHTQVKRPGRATIFQAILFQLFFLCFGENWPWALVPLHMARWKLETGESVCWRCYWGVVTRCKSLRLCSLQSHKLLSLPRGPLLSVFLQQRHTR